MLPPDNCEISVGNLRISTVNKSNLMQFFRTQAFLLNSQIIVTPNIGHLHFLRKNADYLKAMQNAFISLPDGWPIALLATLVSKAIVRRITGSDLILPICKLASENGMTVAFIGGADGSAEKLKTHFKNILPDLEIVICEEFPQLEFEIEDNKRKLVKRIENIEPHFIFLGLGCPKQEIFASKHLTNSKFGIALCIGAGLDFLTGDQNRAPRIWQVLGLEWLFRLLSNPVRLFARYINGFYEYFRLIFVESAKLLMRRKAS